MEYKFYSTSMNRQRNKMVEKYFVKCNVVATIEAIYSLYCDKEILLEGWICQAINNKVLLMVC